MSFPTESCVIPVEGYETQNKIYLWTHNETDFYAYYLYGPYPLRPQKNMHNVIGSLNLSQN